MALTASEVREHRKRKGWQQARLADALGVSPTYVCNIEAGTVAITPSLERRLRVALEGPASETERRVIDLEQRIARLEAWALGREPDGL